jgi:hypothetical protein
MVPFKFPDIREHDPFKGRRKHNQNRPKIDMHEPVKIRYAGRYFPRQAGKTVSDSHKSF